MTGVTLNANLLCFQLIIFIAPSIGVEFPLMLQTNSVIGEPMNFRQLRTALLNKLQASFPNDGNSDNNYHKIVKKQMADSDSGELRKRKRSVFDLPLEEDDHTIAEVLKKPENTVNPYESKYPLNDTLKDFLEGKKNFSDYLKTLSAASNIELYDETKLMSNPTMNSETDTSQTPEQYPDLENQEVPIIETNSTGTIDDNDGDNVDDDNIDLKNFNFIFSKEVNKNIFNSNKEEENNNNNNNNINNINYNREEKNNDNNFNKEENITNNMNYNKEVGNNNIIYNKEEESNNNDMNYSKEENNNSNNNNNNDINYNKEEENNNNNNDDINYNKEEEKNNNNNNDDDDNNNNNNIKYNKEQKNNINNKNNNNNYKNNNTNSHINYKNIGNIKSYDKNKDNYVNKSNNINKSNDVNQKNDINKNYDKNKNNDINQSNNINKSCDNKKIKDNKKCNDNKKNTVNTKNMLDNKKKKEKEKEKEKELEAIKGKENPLCKKKLLKIPDQFDHCAYYEFEANNFGCLKLKHKRCPKGKYFSFETAECENITVKGLLGNKRNETKKVRKKRSMKYSGSMKSLPPTSGPVDEQDPSNEWMDANQGTSSIPAEFKPLKKPELKIFHIIMQKKLHSIIKKRKARRVSDPTNTASRRYTGIPKIKRQEPKIRRSKSLEIHIHKKARNSEDMAEGEEDENDESYDEEENDDEEEEDEIDEEEEEEEPNDDVETENSHKGSVSSKEAIKEFLRSAKEAVANRVKFDEGPSEWKDSQKSATFKNKKLGERGSLKSKKSEQSENFLNKKKKLLIDANIKVDSSLSNALKSVLDSGIKEDKKLSAVTANNDDNNNNNNNDNNTPTDDEALISDRGSQDQLDPELIRMYEHLLRHNPRVKRYFNTKRATRSMKGSEKWVTK